MGKDILKLKSFHKSIEKCAAAVKPLGLDLYKLLTDSTDADYEDPTISFVGIAAIQVALLDLLHDMKIEAQGFVGHSAGEIGEFQIPWNSKTCGNAILSSNFSKILFVFLQKNSLSLRIVPRNILK